MKNEYNNVIMFCVSTVNETYLLVVAEALRHVRCNCNLVTLKLKA